MFCSRSNGCDCDHLTRIQATDLAPPYSARVPLGSPPPGLARRGHAATVLEADGTVGGIAKTVEFEGYRFDLGGHRFYTKLEPVQRLWEEMLGDELLTRPRMSRIYYRGRFFNYPLRAAGRLPRPRRDRVGPLRALLLLLAPAAAATCSRRPSRTGSCSRFGRRLYDAFFRSYTEKVWGIPGSEIQAEWAAQRIQEFSLWQAILGILGLRPRPRADPDRGVPLPAARPRADVGGVRRLGRGARDPGAAQPPLRRDPPHRRHASRASSCATTADEREYDVDAVLSSIPLPELIESLDPPAPRRGARRGARGCATATSAWSR